MARIIECVPNFSEGRRPEIIAEIVKAIAEANLPENGKAGEMRPSAHPVQVLHIDPGKATNRTVVTFAGSPEAVCEAAYQGVKKAAELIDMRTHQGTHPRIGATDVLPLVPVSEVTLEECAAMARQLARRIYEELGIPCYCYEAAAFRPERKNLAVCRSGEYESLAEKIQDPDRRPDYAPDQMTAMAAKAGATNVGARNFLLAVNFNLNTVSTEIAEDIACEVREKGRKAREGGRPDGKILKDEQGKDRWIRGTLKSCKAIGWYIEEYGIAQVSMNITDFHKTPLHAAYEEVCRAAQKRGVQVTGTEIIGLVPEEVLIDAGNYFLAQNGKDFQQREHADIEKIIQAAIQSMHLDDLKPFDPQQKVISYLLQDDSSANKID